MKNEKINDIVELLLDILKNEEIIDDCQTYGDNIFVIAPKGCICEDDTLTLEVKDEESYPFVINSSQTLDKIALYNQLELLNGLKESYKMEYGEDFNDEDR